MFKKMEKVFDIIGEILAVVLVIVFALLIIDANFPFLSNVEWLKNAFEIIRTYGSLVLIAVVGLEAMAKRNFIFQIIFLALLALIVVFLFFLFKELVMILGGAVMLAIGLRPGAAEIYGKVATFVFYGVMVVVLAFGPEIGALREWFTLPKPVMIVLVIISAALTFVALLSYLPSTFRQFKERKHKSEEK